MEHNAGACDFRTSQSWTILSPIEQSIKRKIEAVGVPLREWDIQINYGIKTGYNEAFIISEAKRDEILGNCTDNSERQRTAELIRPILRGRDIKRYGYEDSKMYLIATFPARNYDIDQYPAVKSYLLSFAEPMLRKAGLDWVADNHLADFCYQKLAQTGQYVEIAEQRIRIGSEDEKARKRTTNKWFETQDSISYWEDFSLPKIVYPETTQGAYFALDTEKHMLDKTCFFMISAVPLYLQSTLASHLFEFAYKRIFSSIELGTNGYQYNKHALVKLPIIQTNEDIRLTNADIYRLYGISEEEIEFIESQYIQ